MSEIKKIEIKSIKELIKVGESDDEIIRICNRLYDMTNSILEDYPKHKTWFYKKQLPETLDEKGRRDIIFAIDERKNLLGTAFVKDDDNEKKICTLFVLPNERRKGIGTKLVEKSMQILKTTKPTITLAEYKYPMFEKLIKRYGWVQTDIVTGLYNESFAELIYNGSMEK